MTEVKIAYRPKKKGKKNANRLNASGNLLTYMKKKKKNICKCEKNLCSRVERGSGPMGKGKCCTN